MFKAKFVKKQSVQVNEDATTSCPMPRWSGKEKKIGTAVNAACQGHLYA
jgi:hypothetical protein